MGKLRWNGVPSCKKGKHQESWGLKSYRMWCFVIGWVVDVFWTHYSLLKCHELFAQHYSITAQKTCIFSRIALRTFNLAPGKFFLTWGKSHCSRVVRYTILVFMFSTKKQIACICHGKCLVSIHFWGIIHWYGDSCYYRNAHSLCHWRQL